MTTTEIESESRAPAGPRDEDTPLSARVPLAHKAILAAITLLMVAVVPDWSSSTWAPKEAVLVVLAACGLPVLFILALGRGHATARPVRTAAGLALAFVLVALASALASPSPGIAMVGLYQQGTGWVFVAGMAGAWALATRLRSEGRRWLEMLLVLAAVANSVVAVLQVTVGLNGLGLPLYNSSQADGLQGNPVELGAIAIAAIALADDRFHARPREWYLPLGIAAIGAGVCGQRLPLLIVVGILAWSIRKSLARDAKASGRNRKTTFAFCMTTLAGVVAGVLIGSVSTSSGSLQRAASSTSEETFGQRFMAWKEGLVAFSHHFLIGAGPGQFRSVTSALFPLSFVRPNPGEVFTDAHNFLVEYLTTTGILGALALLGWLAVNLARARGPLVAAAVVLLAVELVEPLNPAVAPVALACLGAAFAGRYAPRAAPLAGTANGETVQQRAPASLPAVVRAVVTLFTLVGVVAGGLLITGDGLMQRAQGQFNLVQDNAALSNASTADDLLRAWPDPASLTAKIYFYKSFGGHVSERPLAVKWAAIASSRDPTDPALLVNEAGYELNDGLYAAAQKTSLAAVRNLPWWPAALDDLGLAYLALGDNAEAHKWFGVSLEVSAQQPQIERFYNGSCKLQKNDLGLSLLTKVCA